MFIMFTYEVFQGFEVICNILTGLSYGQEDLGYPALLVLLGCCTVRIYIAWCCKRTNRLMTEATRHRATKMKIKILTNQFVIRKVMLLHLCLVTSCPYKPWKLAESNY
jgi:hypothetical protein